GVTGSTAYCLVTVGGISSNNNLSFTVPVPQVTSVSPSTAAVGTQITITGSAFGATQGSSSALLNGVNGYVGAQIVSWGNTQIVAIIPSGAITGPVKVNTTGGLTGCGKTRFKANGVPRNSLVSTAQPDKKKYAWKRRAAVGCVQLRKPRAAS